MNIGGSYRRDEYATSSHASKELKIAKEELYQKRFPEAETKKVVDQFFDAKKFAFLGEDKTRPLVYVVAPSTSGANTLPRHFAAKLAAEYPGEIRVAWAQPLAVLRAAKKGALAKMKEPPRYEVIRPIEMPANARVVLVDDVVTTGQSVGAMTEALKGQGINVHDVVSLAQSEIRKVSVADMDRLTDKLGAGIRPAMEETFQAYPLKHYANYIERLTPAKNDDSTYANELRQTIRTHFESEAGRLRQHRQSHPGTDRRIGSRSGTDSEPEFGHGDRSQVQPRSPTEDSLLRGREDDTKDRDTKTTLTTEAATNQNPTNRITMETIATQKPLKALTGNDDGISTISTTPGVELSGLDQRHRRELIETLTTLREQYERQTDAESRSSIVSKADDVALAFFQGNDDKVGAISIKTRHAAQDYVKGKVDITHVAAIAQNYSAAISNAVLDERQQSVMTGIKAKSPKV